MRMSTAVSLGLATTVLAAVIGRAQVPPPEPPASPRKAVEKALPLLQESARIWTRERSCFSCHHQGLGITAVALARERGFPVDEAKFAAQVTATQQDLVLPDVGARLPPNAGVLEDTLKLVALGAAGAAPDAATDREVYRVLGTQHVSGHWTSYPLRLPLEGSYFPDTAWAIRALRLYASPSHSREADARVRRAVDWLARQPPLDTQDLAMQLLGFAWSGTASDRIAKATTQLLALQRADGGWGQIATRPSDAYATGQALVALNQAGRLSPSNAAFKKGLAFLTSSQQADGSWLVETRRTWKQGLAYFESGFPHGKHQFVSYAGSAWAAMALMLADRDERSAVMMGHRTTSPARQSTTAVADAATSADDGLTPLMRAALLGTFDEFRAALKQDANINAVATELSVTALMCAAHDARKVAMLLEAGADLKAATPGGHTALHVAAAYDGAAESVKLLLKHGADPNARGRGLFASPLARAALRGDRAVAALLIDAGATINRPEGSIALMGAANQSDVEFVAFLLDRGAMVDSHVVAMPPVGNGDQQPTALMVAAERSAPDLIALLLKRGANVNATDRRGMTALMYAAGAIDVGPQTRTVVDMLLAAKADVSARTSAGSTALDFAVRHGNAEVAARLRAVSDSAARPGDRAQR